MIRLRRLDHVGLRVADLDEAAARWSIQFGLTDAGSEGGRRLLRCGYEPYSLELVAGEPGPRPHRLASSRATRRRTTRPATWPSSRSPTSAARTASGCTTRTASQCSWCPSCEEDDRRPDIARTGAGLPGFRPRRIGHVNFLTGRIHEQEVFHRDVLGMEVADWLGDDGVWLHVTSEHHQVAFVNKGSAHLHHVAFDMVDWGMLRVAFDHLAQHGRWLGWGPVRHGIAQNMCGYVRITEEPMFVELYCDMEQLEPGHIPRRWPDDRHSSNTWGPLPPRSYFRFDDEAIRYERESLETLGEKLPPLEEVRF